jgi:hypothetical protein
LELCAACDRVLLERATPRRIAIPWLHVVREHPAFLQAYEELWQTGPDFHRLATAVARFGARHAGALAGGDAPLHLSSSAREVDILFVSHLVSVAHAGAQADFYFGDLPAAAARAGYKAAIFVVDHTARSPAELARRWVGAEVVRVVPSARLRASAELALTWTLLAEARTLAKSARTATVSLDRAVRLRAARHALSGAAAKNLRLGIQVRDAVDRLRPQVVVLPFEGHAWERCVIHAAREAVSRPLVAAYQHAAVFRLQHAVRRALPADWMPDMILAAGRVGRDQLSATPGLAGVPIEVLGSPRGTGGARESSAPGACDAGRDRRCLVLPEGIASECRLMFDFALATARAAPDIEFVWRLHPILSVAEVEEAAPVLRQLPRNVQWSSASLAEDAARCGWTLYRGTTSVVDAVRRGSRPVYLEVPGELPVDPLYGVAAGRPAVSTVAALARVVRQPADAIVTEAVRRFCEDFYTPIDPDVLLRHLPAAAPRRPAEAWT